MRSNEKIIMHGSGWKGISKGQLYTGNVISSLEANHLIWVWIMKVKWSKNQADFNEILYVIVNAWGATF